MRSRARRCVPVVLSSLAFAACATTPSPSDVVRGMIAADNRGDLGAVVASYTDDVVWSPPSGGEMRGKDVITAHYQKMFAEQALALEVTIEREVPVAGGVEVHGLVRGQVTPRAGGAPTPANDRFVATLRRTDGGWRVARLQWAPVAK